MPKEKCGSHSDFESYSPPPRRSLQTGAVHEEFQPSCLITPACIDCAGIYNPSLQALPESGSQHFINSHLSAANLKKAREAVRQCHSESAADGRRISTSKRVRSWDSSLRSEWQTKAYGRLSDSLLKSFLFLNYKCAMPNAKWEMCFVLFMV